MRWFIKLLTIFLGVAALNAGLYGQEKNLVQVKVFDKQMNPMSGIGVSVNEKETFQIEEKKSTFHEIAREDLPPKSIKVNRSEWDVESWNYTKGILEIIIRKKQYNIVEITVQTTDKKPVSGVAVTFKGRQSYNATTGALGEFKLPLALDEQIISNDQFTLAGYRISKMQNVDKGKTLLAVPITKMKEVQTPEFVTDFNLEQLDSIRSLTVFYALFKDFDMSKLDVATRAKIDAKFNTLVDQLKESEPNQRFMSRISDSSFVRNDVANLLEQAKFENNLLDNFRNDFDQKIKIINQKLSGGTATLNPTDREKLLNDLTRLEDVLEQNEDKFYKNISDYRIILASLKASFSDIKALEDKLSLSEMKRLEEQKDFRVKILWAAAVTIVFGVLIILLFLLRVRVEKQKQSLVRANAEVQSINENLEGLVFERSKLLMEAYQEMDIFLYRASHDLRAPICTIIGLCNLALHTDEGDTDIINKISNTAIKMDGMLKKLRMISEVNQPSNYSPVFITDMIRNVTRFFEEFITEKNVELIIDSDNEQGFYSYPDLLEIILYNLIENALFFSSLTREHHPKINIMASVEDDNLFISVYDNGIGMDDKTKLRLWDMFFVGHEHSKGNGLGLYIVFKSVQSLNGKIDVQTEPHAFTRFSITIPINQKAPSTVTRLSSTKVLLPSFN